MPGPVRSITKPELAPQDQAATAPKEIMRLVSWLMSNASDVVRSLGLVTERPCETDALRWQDDLFFDPGEGESVRAIREVHGFYCLKTPRSTDSIVESRHGSGLPFAVRRY